jgi:hypothetical protein
MYLPVSYQSFIYAAARKALLFFVLLLPGLAVFADTSDSTSDESTGEVLKAQQQFSFPAWPERPQYRKENVPPPPPGPYMSSALNDYTFTRPPFDNELPYEQVPPVDQNNTGLVMDTFSPDVPWPDDRRGEVQGVNRWMPENGYQYIQPSSGAVGAQQKAYYDYWGRRGQSPQDRGQNLNAPRWMPAMGNGANRYYGPYGGNRPDQFYNQSSNRPSRQ